MPFNNIIRFVCCSPIFYPHIILSVSSFYWIYLITISSFPFIRIGITAALMPQNVTVQFQLTTVTVRLHALDCMQIYIILMTPQLSIQMNTSLLISPNKVNIIISVFGISFSDNLKILLSYPIEREYVVYMGALSLSK